jgi:sugar lactone lactonase YvrE
LDFWTFGLFRKKNLEKKKNLFCVLSEMTRNTTTIALVIVIALCQSTSAWQLELLASWTSLEWDWQSMDESRQQWLDSAKFIRDNCALAGVADYERTVYLTVPRWKPGVPATMNTLVHSDNGVPLLRPFPSLQDNDPNASEGLKLAYVQSMAVVGSQMWMIDTGFQNQAAGTFIDGRPRLVVIDLADNNRLLFDFTLPTSVAPIGNLTFLNDLRVDAKRNVAYITDSFGDGGIIVVDAPARSARRFTARQTEAEPEHARVNYCGAATFTSEPPTPSDGIALSADTETLYFCALNGVSLYSIATADLRNAQLNNAQLSERTTLVGKKRGLSDGLKLVGELMFYGNLGGCEVNVWNTSEPLTAESQHVVAHDAYTLDWQDSFAADASNERLYMTTNRLEYFFNDAGDLTGNSGDNYRLWSITI